VSVRAFAPAANADARGRHSLRNHDFEEALRLARANDSAYQQLCTHKVPSSWRPAQKREFIDATVANEVTRALFFSRSNEDILDSFAFP
jgi:hypothetical protein